jgi:hypothetical protein
MRLIQAARVSLGAAGVAAVLTVGAGCTPAGQAAAWNVAGQFETALTDHDGDGACRLLSDEARHRLETASTRPCPAALEALSLPAGPVRSIQTWGGNSQVHLDGAVLFLAEFHAGWRVTAAGCTPRPDQPYDCVVAA